MRPEFVSFFFSFFCFFLASCSVEQGLGNATRAPVPRRLFCGHGNGGKKKKLVMAAVAEGFGKNKAAEWRGAAASWPLAGSLQLIYYRLDGWFFSFFSQGLGLVAGHSGKLTTIT